LNPRLGGDVRVGQIDLFLALLPQDGSDLESATVTVIEQGSEDRRRVKVWERHKVNRAVHPHQSDRMQIANHAVILDRLVRHGHDLLPGPLDTLMVFTRDLA
jgi:hypothetical protein